MEAGDFSLHPFFRCTHSFSVKKSLSESEIAFQRVQLGGRHHERLVPEVTPGVETGDMGGIPRSVRIASGKNERSLRFVYM
jgi:hypothetical protein